jgi:hypothetical protein
MFTDVIQPESAGALFFRTRKEFGHLWRVM